MTLIAAVLLLAGTLLGATAVLAYVDNAWHTPDWETMRIARAVATWSRRGIGAGLAGWIGAGNTTGPALLPWLLIAFAAAITTYCTAPGKLTVDGRPMP